MEKIYFVCWNSVWLYSSEIFKAELWLQRHNRRPSLLRSYGLVLYYFTVELSFSEDLNFSEELSFSEELGYSEFYITRLQTYLNCLP